MKPLLIVEGYRLSRVRRDEARGVKAASAVYAEAIRAHFPELRTCVLYAAEPGQSLPQDTSLADYAGLVIGGSSLHAYDSDFAVTNQVELLRAYGETGGPMLGSCWGLQVGVVAAGGDVAPSPNGRELGIARKLTLTAPGRMHAMFAGKPAVFDAPCIHYDEITQLPAGAVTLCANRHSPVQAAVLPLGRSEFWGVQYHPEFDLQHLAQLLSLEDDTLVGTQFFSGHDELAAYTANLQALAADPQDRPRAWQLGVDEDVLDPRLRRAEIINWVETQVLRARGIQAPAAGRAARDARPSSRR